MASRYIVHKDGETLAVSIARTETGYRLELEGETVQVDCRAVGTSGVRSLVIDGDSYETATMTGRDGVDVYVSGDVFHVRVTDELWARAEATAAAGGDRERVVSPMPGAVVRIEVEPGQVVAPGDTVAVVEAMKMQNDLAAVQGGRVEAVHAKPGDVVEQGTVLVVLGPETAPETAPEAGPDA